jgi:ABC-type transport system involved in cytochrome c biogenesis permease subunit
MTFAESGGSLFFTVTAATYAGSFANYVASLTSPKAIIARLATTLRLVALAIHTVFLATRYVQTGILEVGAREAQGIHLTGSEWFWTFVSHPPYTNLFESLLFVTWIIMVAYAFIEWKWKLHPLGVVAVALTLGGLAEAYIVLDKDIGVLNPALQSRWILIHVGIIFVSYALFLLAAFIGVLYLLKAGVKNSKIGFIHVGLSALVTLAAGGVKGLLGHGTFEVTPIGQHQTKSLISGAMRTVWSAVHYVPEGSDKAVRFWVAIPGVGPTVLIAVAVLLAAAYFWWRENKSGVEENTKGLAYKVTLAGFGVLTLGLGLLIYRMASTAPLTADVLPPVRFTMEPPFRLSVGSNYSLGLLATTWAAIGLFLGTISLRDTITAKLPEPKRLDDIVYKVVIFAFPLLSIGIVLGGMWAAAAWGRFWGWDPKETWALITWAMYAIYLHVRITHGPGRVPNALAVFGFAVVIFTYMGVNLGLTGEGLHVYGAG